jgi:hypothetical protein
MSAHSRRGYKQGCKQCDAYYYPFTFGKINTKASEKRKVRRIVGSPISAIFAKPANEESVTMAFDLSSI